MSLALSLCQYVLHPRRGLGQASPSLEAPRLQALEIRDLFHQHNRKGKILTIKASRYIELVWGSFLAPEIDMIFGDGIGASLVCFFSLRIRSMIYERYIYVYEHDVQRLLHM
jgi:hypothetical protein